MRVEFGFLSRRAGWSWLRIHNFVARGIWNEDGTEILLGPFVVAILWREWADYERD